MTSTATARPAFGRGGDAARQEDEALNASRGGGSFRRTNYLPTMSSGDQIFLRYITDSPDWIYCTTHQFVKTKPKPEGYPEKAKFPESVSPACRKDKAFAGIFTDCWVCDQKVENAYGKTSYPALRIWALACLREEVLGTEAMVAAGQIPPEQVGRRVGFKDKTREVEVPKKDEKGEWVKGADGKIVTETVVEPAIIVVNQAIKNYYGGLQSMYGIYGTVCDRDYVLRLDGEQKDKDYTHIPLEPTASLKPGTPSWQRYLTAIEEQGLSLEDIVMDKASDDFYGTFIDPTKAMPKRDNKDDGSAASSPQQNGAPAQAPAADTAPAGEPAADRLAEMRARVMGKDPAAAAPTAAAPTGNVDFDS